MSLGKWAKPLSRIVNHIVSRKNRKQTLACAETFKTLHDDSGVTISDLDTIAEVCNTGEESHFSVAAKCLGFRGEYTVVSQTSKLKQEYSLCVIPTTLTSEQESSIVATHILKK